MPMTIRPLQSFDELEAGVELQRQTWGRHFDDVVSAALMRVAQKIGGIAAGAFSDEDELVGMVFGLTGLRENAPVHWSHMLAVRPDGRGKGIGTLLKVYQRRRVLPLDIDRMYWTFDPLEARNAHFNLDRLGVRIEDYVVDMYGSGDTSPLHRGLGTDRFVAIWALDAHVVRSRVESIERTMTWDDSGVVATIEASADSPGGPPDDAEEEEDLELVRRAVALPPLIDTVPQLAEGIVAFELADGGVAFVEIPQDVQRLKSARPDEASIWRAATRSAFTHYISIGMSVTGFIRDPQSGRCFYVLNQPSPS